MGDMGRYQVMEIKHGRAAMLGFLHVVVVEAGIKIPTEECLAAPTGCFASLEAVPTAGWLQIMLTMCMIETGNFASKADEGDGDMRASRGCATTTPRSRPSSSTPSAR